MKYRRLSIADRLGFAERMIHAILEEPILLNALERYGIDEDRVREGLGLLQQAQHKDQYQGSAYGKRIAATAKVKELQQEVLDYFRMHRSIVKAVHKKRPEVLVRLGLNKPVRVQRDALIHQATSFYEHVLGQQDIQEGLARYDFTDEVIENRLNGIQALVDARTSQTYKHGKALIATTTRRKAQEKLDDFVAELIGIARIAFRHDKKQLKRLGL